MLSFATIATLWDDENAVAAKFFVCGRNSNTGLQVSEIGKRLLVYAGVALVAATVLAGLGATQVHVQYAVFRVEEIPWSDCLIWAGIEWYAWALLVPFVALLAARYRFDAASAWPKSAFVHIVGATLFAVAHASLQTLGILFFAPNIFGVVEEFTSGVVRLLVSELHWELMSYAMIVATTQVGLYLRRAHSEALARQESETQAARAQLGALKRQMQPHFLFNALNAQVSMLAEGSAAQRFTIRLAEMLRILLATSEQTTATLSEELALVNAYLDVEHARLGSRLATRIEIPDDLLEVRLPSLILQPLVENAITHGISRAPEGGDMLIRVSQSGHEATIEITNSCFDLEGARESKDRHGVTLVNCRRRLELMYGNQARLETGYVGRNVFRASIILPLVGNGLTANEPVTNPDR